ncbi:hypothetical protein M408DRAFT_30429 [Serendipita vermifera MAFF 305830]|uniref:Uncharacterized protein n=1 Tax=Serendipita vermifera MAFF 305830 TaxID=933852 RepID=A0A0C3AJT7_SERVB|nr:hypothetical protein M408DRAFT_30429 [Serendipita vermifera MAFF 305830]
MEQNQPSEQSNTQTLAFYALSPLAALRDWYTRKDPDTAMDHTHEPPYIAPAGFGVSLISHVRSLLWTDGMLQQGYEQVFL